MEKNDIQSNRADIISYINVKETMILGFIYQLLVIYI
jgi:hypothetical protein